MMESGRKDLAQQLAYQASRETFEQHLDEEGIDAALLVNYVSPDVMGFPPSVNDWVCEYTKGSTRLLPMGSVHPHAVSDARAEAERIVALGVHAIKVHPAHQLLYPNDPAFAPVYEVAQHHGIPVTIHTGTSVFPRAKNRFTDPIYVDDVAVDFPNLKILLAHAGRPLWPDASFFLARRHANVFLEISGIPPKRLLDYLPRLPELEGKVVWGSDWPSMGIKSLAQNVRDFLALPGFTDAAKGQVLWETGARLFRLA